MANKRTLKKEIRYVCGDIAGECLLTKNFVKGVEPEAMNECIFKMADLQVSAIESVSFSFDKTRSDFENGQAYRKARKTYFKQAYNSLRDKFYAKVNDIVKEMNAALPQEVKENNKKA